MARGKEDHESRHFASLDSLKFGHNQVMMVCEFEGGPLCDRIAGQVLVRQGKQLVRLQLELTVNHRRQPIRPVRDLVICFSANERILSHATNQ